MIGEGAVQLREKHLQPEREPVEHRRHHQTAHAVGGVCDDMQRAEQRRVDERSHLRRVVGEDVGCRDPTGLRSVGDRTDL
jgi:hypothetical protein